jgi:hypothetical protein
VWHLFALPTRGALRGGLVEALQGLARGISGLVQQTSFATFTTLLKYTRRTRDTLLALCPDNVVSALLSAQAPTLALPHISSHNPLERLAGVGLEVPDVVAPIATAAHKLASAAPSLPELLQRPSTSTTANATHRGTGASPSTSRRTSLDAVVSHSAVLGHGTGLGWPRSSTHGGTGTPMGAGTSAWIARLRSGHSTGPHGPLKALPAGYGAILANINAELSAVHPIALLSQLPAAAVGDDTSSVVPCSHLAPAACVQHGMHVRLGVWWSEDVGS